MHLSPKVPQVMSDSPGGNADSDARHISIGIMCNGRVFPRWQAEAIRSLLALSEIDIRLLIVRAPVGRRSVFDFLRDWRHLLWNLYNKALVERRSYASRGVDLSAELSHVPQIVCETLPIGRFGEALGDEDLDRIRSADLDLILRFGFGIIKGDILESAPFGVWSFHHGDEREYRGQPPGFWELLDQRPTMGVMLQRLTERLDGGVVLQRGDFKVTPHSYLRTRDEAFLGSSDLLVTTIKRLVLRQISPEQAPESTTAAPVRRLPGNAAMIRFLFQQAVAFGRSQWIGVMRAAKWSVGVAALPIHDLITGGVGSIQWIPEQGPGRYLADPFPDPTDRTRIVLVEDYDHAAHRGVISAVDLDGDRLARPVLDPGVHASYPFLFESGGAIFCTPETYQAEEVRLYKARSWPDNWELEATLISGIAALDPTVIEFGGRWWLFCTVAGPYSNSKLLIFHSVDLFAGWEPHALNPVKTSVTSGRPGGTPFVHDGVLYRPAQDSSRSYGAAITINRVDVLTPTNFAETPVASLRPDTNGDYSKGTHTISAMGAETVLDGRRDVFSISATRRELVARLGRRSSGPSARSGGNGL